MLLHVGDRNLPAVLVTNTSGQPRSFTLTATWRQGDTVVATAQGATFALQPRETRAVNLASRTPIPDGAEAGDAQVDRILPLDDAQVQIASKIQLGRPLVRKGALSDVEVMVTNTDSAPHSLTLGAALLDKDSLIGTASGSAMAIGPRVGLPVSLTIAGADSGYDRILVYVTSVTS